MDNKGLFDFAVDEKIFPSGDLILRDPGPVQINYMHKFRLTEAFKKAYTEHLLYEYPNGVAVKRAVEAIKKFTGVSEVDLRENNDLIKDFLYATLVLGFFRWEFFFYGLAGKSISECMEYLTNRALLEYYNAINRDKKSNGILDVKHLTYKHFKPYYKRELVIVRTEDDRATFVDFAERIKRFIVKPSASSFGNGVRIINIADYANIDAVFDEVLGDCVDNKSVVCEEVINQHECFAVAHPESVNTVRIYTYHNGTDTKVPWGLFKTGRGSTIVDNGGAGGILAAVDCSNGVVCTDAYDEIGNVFPTHPDTGFVFKGFQIPGWDEAVEIAKEMAAQLPGAPLIGWDFALSKDKGWQVIEGNRRGQICVFQGVLRYGNRKEFFDAVEWEKHRKYLARK